MNRIPFEVEKDIFCSGVDLDESDLHVIWNELERLVRLPLTGYKPTQLGSQVTVSFKGTNGTTEEETTGTLEELLSLVDVPDMVPELFMAFRVNFQSEHDASDNRVRSLGVGVSNEDGLSGIHAEGDRDWVVSAIHQLTPILDRRKRNVVPARIGLSVGFTLPVGVVLLVWSWGLVTTDFLFAITLEAVAVLILSFGSLMLNLWAQKVLPSSRLAIRGEPRDPLVLRLLWTAAYGIMTAVAAGLIVWLIAGHSI
jgi:hypothetical protein